MSQIYEKCERCGGTGGVIMPQAARALREAKKMTLAHVAGKMGMSKSYLHDLEMGRRTWTHDLEQRLRKALK